MDHPPCIADPWKFPMLRVPEVRAYVHALPVTKAQVNAALARGKLCRDGWDQLAEHNPDVPLAALGADNYWGVFAGGVTPEQAADFAACCGPDFRVPTAGEWRQACAVLARCRFDLLGGTLATVSGTFARDLLARLDRVAYELGASSLEGPPSLADRLFWRRGVMEWVRLVPRNECNAGDYGGLGSPAPALWPALFDPLLDAPVRPREPEQAHRAFGVRLFRACDEETPWS